MPTFLFLGSRMAQFDTKLQDSLEARVTNLAEHLAAGMGMEVVLVEFRRGGGRSIVRVFIDQTTGISLDDCERFSRRLSVILDVEDWIPSRYILEVSSPGLDRPLVKEMDFQRFAGKNANVRTRTSLEGQRNFTGKILGVTDGRLGLEIAPGRQVGIAMSDIERANLVIEI